MQELDIPGVLYRGHHVLPRGIPECIQDVSERPVGLNVVSNHVLRVLLERYSIGNHATYRLTGVLDFPNLLV